MTAIGAAVIAVCYGFARYAYGLFVPRFGEDFQLGGAGLGLLGGLSTAGYVLGLLTAPRVAGRGPRAAVLAAGGVAALGLALMGLTDSVVVFAIGLVVAGSSAGLVSPAVAEMIARGVEQSVRAQAQTWANTGTSFGLAASAFTPALAVGWQAIWLGFAATAVAVTLVAAVRLPRHPGGADPGPSQRPRPDVEGPDGEGAGWPRGLTALVLNSVLIGLTSAPFWTFFIARAHESGVTAVSTTWCWFTIGAVGPLGGLAGWLAGRVGLRAANVGIWTLWAGGLGLLALPSPGLLGSLGAAAVLGATYMALTGLCILWGSRLFPARPSHGVTLSFLALGVGQTVGSALAGTLTDAVGFAATFGIAALLSLTAWLQLHPRLAGNLHREQPNCLVDEAGESPRAGQWTVDLAEVHRVVEIGLLRLPGARDVEVVHDQQLLEEVRGLDQLHARRCPHP
ncbi:MAG: hypothetical protein QOJ32_3397 [Frankiaceae bacterium]|nr:hypothetical protein [Frankiaceae bacterium]